MVVLENQDFLDRVDAMIRSAVARALATTPATTAIQQAVEDDLLTIKQAAEMLDVSVATIHEYKRRGMLRATKKLLDGLISVVAPCWRLVLSINARRSPAVQRVSRQPTNT